MLQLFLFKKMKEGFLEMAEINNRLYELPGEALFSNVAKKTKEFESKNPDKKVISLGVGDVSKPIVQPIIKAMHKAVDDLSDMKTFKGYGSSHGYPFLKDKILENDYKYFNFTKDEIYISCGTKTDSTNILELFDIDAKICILNPMYPIYKDGGTCLNRKFFELDLSEEKNFVPDIPKEKYDLLYLCSPNNPIGTTYTYDELKKLVDYAVENECII